MRIIQRNNNNESSENNNSMNKILAAAATVAGKSSSTGQRTSGRSIASVDTVDYGYETHIPRTRRSSAEELDNHNNRNNDSYDIYTEEIRKNELFAKKLQFLQQLWTVENAAKVLNSKTWTRLFLVIVILMIYVPASVLILFIPKKLDGLAITFYTLCFLILTIDVALRCVAQINYFCWRFHCQGRFCTLIVGSFAFWLDVLSTISVISTIVWIVGGRQTAQIVLNEYDFPISGYSQLQKYNLISRNDIFNIFRTVMRLGIMYRFVRQVTISTSRVNWYYQIMKLIPCQNNFQSSNSYNTFYGIRLFSGGEKEGLNTAAITIQKWWREIYRDKIKKKKRPQRRRSSVGKLLRGTSATSLEKQIRIQDERVTSKSQIGATMEELTGQRVAQGIILIVALSLTFTYFDQKFVEQYAMMVLHKQARFPGYEDLAVASARNNALANMFQYTYANGTTQNFLLKSGVDTTTLRDSEILEITVSDALGYVSSSLCSQRAETLQEAKLTLILLSFLLVIWFFSNIAFSGPIIQLVVIPIERMISLIGMMMKDPLGFQTSGKFYKFTAEEKKLTDHTGWTTQTLKGMETSFLMSTILQISSLLKVGFGAAGVDVIRNSLEKSQAKARTSLVLNTHGATAKCIFLFCDVRQFTDTTECLLEEIFVFTNKVASIVHPICSAYGGSANKNVGDAFLMSWVIGQPKTGKVQKNKRRVQLNSFIDVINRVRSSQTHQTDADRSLLAVVKIMCALYHDNYILESLTEHAQNRLLEKFADRPGPLVQLGFGLHLGDAVVGAIGSQRKIDATYLSVNVDFAEYLESSTKTYGLRMLMSSEFYESLHALNKRRCRMIDRVCLDYVAWDEDIDTNAVAKFSVTQLFTLDLDIDALWKMPKADEDSILDSKKQFIDESSSAEKTDDEVDSDDVDFSKRKVPKLDIPTGFVLYKESDWQTDDMIEMRKKFMSFNFFELYHNALESFYSRNWDQAQRLFLHILSRFEDGPSRYFLTKIQINNGVPPKGFQEFNY